MKIGVYPIKVEIVEDDLKEILAVVEAFDEFAASVDIRTVVDGGTWPEMSEAVAQALAMLKLGGADMIDAPRIERRVQA